MFFRREKPAVPTFEERLQTLKEIGFQVAREQGRTVVMRDGFAAVVEQRGDTPLIGTVGLSVGNEIAVLTDLGYQKVFETPGGRREPARAEHLRALHDFTEDLKEGLGLISLYNEGLGTVNQRHVYDRVANRDAGVQTPPWQR